MTGEELALIIESVDSITASQAIAERYYMTGEIDRAKACHYRARTTRERLVKLLETMVDDV